MAPMPLARTFTAEMRFALQGFERTLREGMWFDPATSECCFTLSMRDVLETTLLPPLMAAIAREAPCVDVTIVRRGRWQLETELLIGAIDVVMDTLPPTSPVIRHTPLLTNPTVVLTRPDHPTTNDPLTLERYLACRHVHVSSRRRGTGLEDVELCRLGHERRVWLHYQYYPAACCVANCTDLSAMLPTCYACIVNRPYGDVMPPLPFNVQSLELYSYWHTNSDQDAASRRLCDHVFTVMVEVALGDIAVAFVDGR